MAILIIGMLAVGKYMVGLEESDPLRFSLTQLHKSFGVLILFLAVARLLWRLTHKSPAHPDGAPAWERFAAGVSHWLIYILLFAAPVTGWMLVSVSPLNIDTLLFDQIPWPHLPWLHNAANKAELIHRYEWFHEIATGLLIALLVLHVGAALKHHFVDRDNVLTRMLPMTNPGATRHFVLFSIAVALLTSGAVFGYAALYSRAAPSLNAGSSQVSAVASVMGDETLVEFPESTVELQLLPDNPEQSSLRATVPTAGVQSSNAQVQGALPMAEWFDSANHPNAVFESTRLTALSVNEYEVEGTLMIKGISHTHSFTMTLTENEGTQQASGQFLVDRVAYELGLESQPTTDYVAGDVQIRFSFDIQTSAN